MSEDKTATAAATEPKNLKASHRALIFILEHVSISNPELEAKAEELAAEVHKEYGIDPEAEPSEETPATSKRFSGRFGKKKPSATKKALTK